MNNLNKILEIVWSNKVLNFVTCSSIQVTQEKYKLMSKLTSLIPGFHHKETSQVDVPGAMLMEMTSDVTLSLFGDSLNIQSKRLGFTRRVF